MVTMMHTIRDEYDVIWFNLKRSTLEITAIVGCEVKKFKTTNKELPKDFKQKLKKWLE